MKAFEFFKKYWVGLLQSILVVSLLPFTILSFFNHPVYDDFGNAVKTLKYGFWGIQKVLYTQWTGRYFSSLLLTVINPMSYGWLGGLRFTPALFLAVIWGAFYLLFRWLTAGQRIRVYSGWFSAALLLVYLYTMPNVFQGFFWYTGAVVYQIGNLLLILVFVGSYKVLHSSTLRLKIAWASLCIVSVIAAAATNEVVLIQLITALGGCFLGSLYQRKTSWRWWLLLGVITLLSAVMSVMAPGNFVRLSVLQTAENAHSITYSVPRTLFSALRMIFSVPVLTALLLLLLGWLPWGNKVAIAGRLSFLRLHPLLAAAGIFGVVCLCYLPFWWLSASYTPVRTENAIVFYILVSWLVAVQAALNWWHCQGKPLPSVPAWLHHYGVPVFGLVLLFRMATVPALFELALNARRYDAHLNARYLYIAEQKEAGNLDIKVEPLPLKHKFSVLTDTTDGADLTEHAKDEQNRYYADYFHVDSIRVRSESSLVSTSK